MRRFFLMSLLVFMILPANLPAAEQTVKIGLSYPETGPYAKQGLDQRRAAEIAAEEINSAGGILGKKIRAGLSRYQIQSENCPG